MATVARPVALATVPEAVSALAACIFVSSETEGTSPGALECIFVTAPRRRCTTLGRPCSC